MDQYAYVRTAYRVYGQTISEIARHTGHSRNTIRKALANEYIGYRSRESQPYPVLSPHQSTIDRWLAEDKERPRKQRHTARRIYDRLSEEEGYRGSEATVRRYVRGAKLRLGVAVEQAFLSLCPKVGEAAEVDWGAALALLDGVESRLKYFCMRSKYSGKPFVRFYPCERQQAFFEAHIEAFEFYGGVFPVLIYDNLSSAVQKVLQGKGRVEQESFRRFRSYYNFEARFCNPAQGHEKGGVEGIVGFARRNYMVPLPEARSLEELNEKLIQQCRHYGQRRLHGRQQAVEVLFEEEKASLLTLPPTRFTNVQTQEARIDKYATVIVDKNRYSVPYTYVGCQARALLYVDRVELFWSGKKLATHSRLYASNQWSLIPEHYLELLRQRPGAFEEARVIQQWRPSWPPSTERLLSQFRQAHGPTQGIKEFLSVLLLRTEHPAEEVQAAIELAVEQHLHSFEGVKHLLLYLQEAPSLSKPLARWASLPAPDLSLYSQLQGSL